MYLPCDGFWGEPYLLAVLSWIWSGKITSLRRCSSVLACYGQAVGLCGPGVLVEVCVLRLDAPVQLYMSQADDRW